MAVYLGYTLRIKTSSMFMSCSFECDFRQQLKFVKKKSSQTIIQ